MARCAHGFELDTLVCPLGCGGTRKMQKQVANARRLPKVRNKAPNSSFTDAELLTVLGSATTVLGAAGRLGCSLSTLYTRAKKTPTLKAAYQAAAERGRSSSRRHLDKLPRRSA